MNYIKNKKIFIYTWGESMEGKIFIFGIDENENNCCCIVENFLPYFYIEIPDIYKNKMEYIYNSLRRLDPNKYNLLKTEYTEKRKLYGCHYNFKNKEFDTFPYIKCFFKNKFSLRKFKESLKKDNLFSTFNLQECTNSANTILQFVTQYNINTVGWVEFDGYIVDEENKIVNCPEFKVSTNNIKSINYEKIVNPTVLSWDIEVYSKDGNFPNSSDPLNEVFQISCVFGKLNSEKMQYIISLGNPIIQDKNIKIVKAESEVDLICKFSKLLKKLQPNITIGYNIFNFDIPFLLKRAEILRCKNEYLDQGFLKNDNDKYDLSKTVRNINWSSRAYSKQQYMFIDALGIVSFDLLPFLEKEYKFSNYKLNYVSHYFLKETKKDMNVADIFKSYKMGVLNKYDDTEDGKYLKKKGDVALGNCALYCMQDAKLVLNLFEKLNVWLTMCEMSKLCNVSPTTLFNQGQQIKTYSQIYKFCFENNIVVENNIFLIDEEYVGAQVLDPKPGKYENVAPLDYSSLYPSIIMAYNIDYSTLYIGEESDLTEKELENFHIFKWEDHVSCVHDKKIIKRKDLEDRILDANFKKDIKRKKELTDIKKDLVKTLNKNKICKQRNFLFLKEPKGVIPTIINNLITKRKEIKKEMADISKKLKDDKSLSDEDIRYLNFKLLILDKSQLSTKVSANSMYGIMGIKSKGVVPLPPGAMCVTYKGRQMIDQTSKYLSENFDGDVIYGDTDSNYVCFKNITDKKLLWKHAEYAAEKISELFPRPIKLEFENVIYDKFIILTKKKYMYTSYNINESGSSDKKIGKKGVILARRDNSMFIKNIYLHITECIFNDYKEEDILFECVMKILEMFQRKIEYKDFVITKSSNEYSTIITKTTNEKGEVKGKMGAYTVPLIPNTEGFSDNQIQQMYLEKLPAHIQLIEKIKNRGHFQDEGCRIQYVILKTDNLKDKQNKKIESYQYFLQHSDILRIDYYYYLERLAQPLSQLIQVVYKNNDFMKNFCKSVYQKDAMLFEFKSKLRKNLI